MRIKIKLIITFCFAMLTACGGGGGAGSVGVTNTNLVGLASLGTPMVNANIRVIDSNGLSLEGSTDSAGVFNVVASGITFPALVFATGTRADQVITLAGIALLDSGSNSVRVNVTPLTDAIITQVLGKSPSYLLENPSELALVSTTQINLVAARLVQAASPVIDAIQAGASTRFNPLNSPFIADGADPYDKVLDLVDVNLTANRARTALDINLTSRVGENRTVTLTSNAVSVERLPVVSATEAGIRIDQLPALIDRMNLAFSSAARVASADFADLFDDSYQHNGQNKTQRLEFLRNPSRSSLVVGTVYKTPKIQRCEGANLTCTVQIHQTNSLGTSIFETRLRYDAVLGRWLNQGNGFDDLMINFSSYALLDRSDDVIKMGVGFGIRDAAKSDQYKSAKVEIFDAQSEPVGEPILFRHKEECPVTGNSYFGMPLNDGTPYNSCATWIDLDDAGDEIREWNQLIKSGGLRLRVRAYSSENWTGDHVAQSEIVLINPLLHPDDITRDMFPRVEMTSDGSGPLLRVRNATDFSLVGSVCLSSAESPQYCDMTNLPRHTSEYRPKTPGVPEPLSSIYRPKVADGWANGATIRSYFINARDKYGRNLRVSN